MCTGEHLPMLYTHAPYQAYIQNMEACMIGYLGVTPRLNTPYSLPSLCAQLAAR